MPSQQKSDQLQPNPKLEWIFREFEGMNTQAFRTSIEDGEFSWLENAMPIGHGNIKVTQHRSAVQHQFSGKNIFYAMSFNIAGVDYHFVVSSDGSAFQMMVKTPFTVTTIAAPGTFTGTAGSIWAAQWKNLGIVIVDSTKGYFDWSITTPNVLTLIDATKTNNLVAVYSGRVWMAFNRTVTFTDANSYNSFAGSGGFFINNDSSLHDRITFLNVSNNFLYVGGSASVQAISDVRVVSGVAVFSNTTVQTSVGSTYPMTVFPYYRSLMMFTPFGIYALYGATPSKVSDALDGIFPFIDFTKQVSGGVVELFNQLCAAFCFTYFDPLLAANRQLIAVFHNKKWFVSNQGSTLSLIWSDVVNGVPTMFGTDGVNVYTLWSDNLTFVMWKVQTKLNDFGSSLMDAQALKAGIEAVIPQPAAVMNVLVDTEANSVSFNISPTNALVLTGSSEMTFTNVTGVMHFISADGNPIIFQGTGVNSIGTGFARYQHDVSNAGKYLGFTITSSSNAVQLCTISMEYIKHTQGLW